MPYGTTLACFRLNTVMKKKNLITIAAVAAAGIAAYFVRKKLVSRGAQDNEPTSGPSGRHLTDAFSKAKSLTDGQQTAIPKMSNE
jgi:hypothetical protein